MKIDLTAHRFFLWVAPAMCLLLVWVTPPMQAPDEYAHFFRSYQIAEGQWQGVRFDNRVGGILPVSLRDTAAAFGNLPRNPQQKMNKPLWRQVWSIPLRPEQRAFTDFSCSGFMHPYAYLPQAAGMRIGMLFNGPPILLLYLGRMVNAAIWCLFVYLALRLMPTAAWLLATLALAPMSIFQAASLSYDATINSLSFLFLALILRRAFAGEYSPNLKDYLVWLLVVTTVVVSKPFYGALALLVYVVPPPALDRITSYLKNRLLWNASREGTRPTETTIIVGPVPSPGVHRSILQNSYLKKGLFLGVVTAVCLGIWSSVPSKYLTYAEYNPKFRDVQALMPGSDPVLQLKYITSHPVDFLRAGVVSLFNRDRSVEWVGNLGWLDTRFPAWFYIGFGLLVLLLVASDRAPGARIAVWQRIMLAGIAALAAMMVLVSVYLVFSPVGSRSVLGVQGRYFVLIAPLVLIALHGNYVRLPDAWRRWGVPIILVAVQVMTIAVIVHRYY